MEVSFGTLATSMSVFYSWKQKFNWEKLLPFIFSTNDSRICSIRIHKVKLTISEIKFEHLSKRTVKFTPQKIIILVVFVKNSKTQIK